VAQADSDTVESTPDAATDKAGKQPPVTVTSDSTESPLPGEVEAEGSQDDAEAELKAALRRRQMEEHVSLLEHLVEQETKMYSTLPSYHAVRERLIEELRAEYTAAEIQDTALLINNARELEKAFWGNGDYEELANLDFLYRARALLELALEGDPANEEALRGLCEVIQAGWRVVVPEPKQKGTEPVMLLERQRRYDVFIPMYNLWEKHLSQEPATTLEDVAFAYDLMVTTWPKYEIEDREAFMKTFRERNPNPSPELVDYIENGIPVEKRLSVAKWALAGAQPPESPISEWSKSLQQAVTALESGSKPSFRQAMLIFAWGEAAPGDTLRYRLGRGFSLRGPQKVHQRNPVLNRAVYDASLEKHGIAVSASPR